MSINLTLVGQMITFLVFVWVTMRYIWPPIDKAMQERQKRIADGLAASDRGKHELELAQHKAVEILREAKLEASHSIDQANNRAGQIVEEAKEKARLESQRILKYTEIEVEQMTAVAKEKLREEMVGLIISGTEKVLEKEVDKKAHDKMLEALVETL